MICAWANWAKLMGETYRGPPLKSVIAASLEAAFVGWYKSQNKYWCLSEHRLAFGSHMACPLNYPAPQHAVLTSLNHWWTNYVTVRWPLLRKQSFEDVELTEWSRVENHIHGHGLGIPKWVEVALILWAQLLEDCCEFCVEEPGKFIQLLHAPNGLVGNPLRGAASDWWHAYYPKLTGPEQVNILQDPYTIGISVLMRQQLFRFHSDSCSCASVFGHVWIQWNGSWKGILPGCQSSEKRGGFTFECVS